MGSSHWRGGSLGGKQVWSCNKILAQRRLMHLKTIFIQTFSPLLIFLIFHLNVFSSHQRSWEAKQMVWRPQLRALAPPRASRGASFCGGRTLSGVWWKYQEILVFDKSTRKWLIRETPAPADQTTGTAATRRPAAAGHHGRPADTDGWKWSEALQLQFRSGSNPNLSRNPLLQSKQLL